MPAIVTAYLYPSTTLMYEVPSSGRIAQSALFSALKASDPSVASGLHRLSAKLRLGTPYSVSRITTAARYVKGVTAVVPAGDHVRLTVKLLRDELVDPYVRGLFNSPLKINGVPVEVAEVKVGRVSYEDLLTGSPVVPGVRLRLMTQTILEGEEFPPPLWEVLQRPIAAWNANAPDHLRLGDPQLEGVWLAQPTSPSWLESGAVKVWYGAEPVVRVGYTGVLSYSLRSLSTFHGRVVSALLRFAEFSGIGKRTTVGFGVVKVSFWRKRSRRGRKSA